MSQQWNGEFVIDQLGQRLWDTSASFRAKIIRWINEIQDDMVGELKLPDFKIKLKKLLDTEEDILDLSPEIPGAPSAVIASGGSLVEDSIYKVLVTFKIFDSNGRDYIESEAGSYSSEVTATSVNKTIDLTDIPVMGGDSSYKPNVIHRCIYVATKADGETSFSEPFLSTTIENNTATTLSITSAPTSTITPPSDSELQELASDAMVFPASSKELVKISSNKVKRFDPNGSTSTTPDMFDFESLKKIFLYPQLSSSATAAQRTLVYFAYRRPHEIFYDRDRRIDLPIAFRKALMAGVIWKAYEYRDRNGVESKLANYEQLKRQVIKRFKRKQGIPGVIRDVNGDTFGWEV